jgi:hypothetical protein
MQAGKASSSRGQATTDVETPEQERLVVRVRQCFMNIWSLKFLLNEDAASQGPSSKGSPDPEVDWGITLALFIFPAIGGLLFGKNVMQSMDTCTADLVLHYMMHLGLLLTHVSPGNRV